MAHSLSSRRVWYEQLRLVQVCADVFLACFLVTSGEFLTVYGVTFRHVGSQAVNCGSELASVGRIDRLFASF